MHKLPHVSSPPGYASGVPKKDQTIQVDSPHNWWTRPIWSNFWQMDSQNLQKNQTSHIITSEISTPKSPNPSEIPNLPIFSPAMNPFAATPEVVPRHLRLPARSRPNLPSARGHGRHLRRSRFFRLRLLQHGEIFGRCFGTTEIRGKKKRDIDTLW